MTAEEVKGKIEAAFPGAVVSLIANNSPSQQASLLLDRKDAQSIAEFLRDDAELQLDYCSNVTGVDWLDRKVKQTAKQIVEGKEVAVTTEVNFPGYLEVVYHLYSISKRHGPVILRLRTPDRTQDVTLPSLTPVWRSAEFQEREVYDLYGVRFTMHPDLRRILMWDEFVDFPMRKDYVEPDDYEYEPTPHDEVLTKAKQHYQPRPANDGAAQVTAQS